jgi:hypothetical protein
VEHRTVSTRQTAGCGRSGDDTARFLRELRQLRDCAGLGQAELAARAHYPCDYIRDAETGPAMPDLPLLAAYIRGCGGIVEDWEERWRSLTNTPALPLLSTRSAGSSTAPTAGARIGPDAHVADLPDPAAIMAALDRVAEKMAASTTSPARSSGATLPPIGGSSFAAFGQPSAAASEKRDIPAEQRVAAPASAAPASAAPASAASTSVASGTGTDIGTDIGTGTGTPIVAKSVTGNGTTNASGASTAATRREVSGRRFSVTSRTASAALIVLAICVIVGVLAVFA